MTNVPINQKPKKKVIVQQEIIENRNESEEPEPEPEPDISREGFEKDVENDENYFNIKIEFPVKEEMQEQFKENFLKEDPFPTKFMFPEHDKEYRCPCGYEQDPRNPVEQGWLETNDIRIQHSRDVKDSRSGYMGLYYRPMVNIDVPNWKSEIPPCSHKAFYTGESDLLLRVTKPMTFHGGSGRPCVFISYEFLFHFHFQTMETTASEKGFLRGFLIFQQMIFGKMFVDNITWNQFRRGYNIFLHCLKHDEKISHGCDECPAELTDTNDKEENYPESIEVHVGDGVDIGNIVNDIKGIPENKLFGNTAPEGSQIKKGVEAVDRTFITNIKQRQVFEKMIKNAEKEGTISNTIKAINAKGKSQLPEHPHVRLAEKVLLHLKDECESKRIPIGYRLLFSELSLETPISALICSHSPKAIEMLRKFLSRDIDIFSSTENVLLMQKNLPIITECIYQIINYEKQIFPDKDNYLPESVSNLLEAMINFKISFDDKAFALDGHLPPKPTQDDAKAEMYPDLPTHTEEELFYADKHKDPEEKRNCHKSYPEAGGITGGISHVTCVHGITKGFTAMQKGTIKKLCHFSREEERRGGGSTIILYVFWYGGEGCFILKQVIQTNLSAEFPHLQYFLGGFMSEYNLVD